MKDDKAVVISILNMKGGVGKTTLTSNLALELSEQGNKVLILDLDPQFNTTQSLFKYKYDSMNKYFEMKEGLLTISTLFMDTTSGVARQIFAKVELQNIIHKLKKNLHIIPGDLSLIAEVNDSSINRLTRHLNEWRIFEVYDYILIDCPPTWGKFTTTALTLSNYYLIPTRLDEFSTIGITILADKLEELVLSGRTSIKCLGVVYMMLGKTSRKLGVSRDQEGYKNVIEKFFNESVNDQKSMSERVKSKVEPFETKIYNYQKVSHNSSIYKTYDNYPQLMLSIRDLAIEMTSRISKTGYFEIGGE
ncbi:MULTISPECIES: ParA family protein [Paenibacillus]|uniref:ParA family protein n=1 Tax=Paenibacillus TaxID=44249 RepID=UPI00040F8A39|nr:MULTISPECIES: AAA family ATPase [Paenibacillus]UMY53500.1 AAA family ATPase [Paenibacillus peoriae]